MSKARSTIYAYRPDSRLRLNLGAKQPEALVDGMSFVALPSVDYCKHIVDFDAVDGKYMDFALIMVVG